MRGEPDGEAAATDEDPQPQVFLTAVEAYPAFEACFLDAEREIVGSFRIFEPGTKLRGERALQIGDTWADLIVATLERGVDITLTISDFDPIGGTKLHRGTHASLRAFDELGRRVTGAGAGTLLAEAARHPADVGTLARLMFWPLVQKRLGERAATLNALEPEERQRRLDDLPDLRPYLRQPDGRGGEVRVRRNCVPKLYPVTHHQKLAVFDRKLLYIGGLDLDNRRYDDLDHERQPKQTWYDVQALVGGKLAEDGYRHLRQFRDEVAGDKPPGPAGGLLRTLSARRVRGPFRLSPKTVATELRRAHEAAIDAARGLVYLETQFFRDRPMARRLAQAGRDRPDLSLLLVVPAAPERLAFDGETGIAVRWGEFLQAECVRILRRGFRDRMFVASPAQPRRGEATGRAALLGAPIIYVHAKLSIFGDDLALVSSANLNGRSLTWDTEAGISLNDPALIADLRRRCFRHWLPEDAEDRLLDPATAVTAWRDLANDNAVLEPEQRRGYILPYTSRPARRLGTDVDPLPEGLV